MSCQRNECENSPLPSDFGIDFEEAVGEDWTVIRKEHEVFKQNSGCCDFHCSSKNICETEVLNDQGSSSPIGFASGKRAQSALQGVEMEESRNKLSMNRIKAQIERVRHKALVQMVHASSQQVRSHFDNILQPSAQKPNIFAEFQEAYDRFLLDQTELSLQSVRLDTAENRLHETEQEIARGGHWVVALPPSFDHHDSNGSEGMVTESYHECSGN